MKATRAAVEEGSVQGRRRGITALRACVGEAEAGRGRGNRDHRSDEGDADSVAECGGDPGPAADNGSPGISEIKEDQKAPAMPPGGGMGGMY